jgi:hypothetical protein
MKFAGEVLKNIGVPAMLLGTAGLAGAGAGVAGYALGNKIAGGRKKEYDPQMLHDSILYEVQSKNPELTANQSAYYAAKIFADLTNQGDGYVDSYMMDIGADQGDSWSSLVPAGNRHGKAMEYREHSPSSEHGYIYAGNDQWEPGEAWSGNRSQRIW